MHLILSLTKGHLSNKDKNILQKGQKYFAEGVSLLERNYWRIRTLFCAKELCPY